MLQLSHADQTAQVDYTYGAYGQTTETPPGASSNLIRYTGREQETANLYYYRNRYCSTGTSRSISEDPIGLAGGANLYTYVNGNPVSNSDPSGKNTIAAGGAAGFSLGGPIGAVIGIALGAAATYGIIQLCKDDTSDKSRCEKVLKECRSQCTDIYVDDPNKLPGTGSDMPGRIRRCILECMERSNCYDF